MMMIVIVMMIASYTNDADRHRDDDRIVHTLTIYGAIFFGNGRTNKAILGVGCEMPWNTLQDVSNLSNQKLPS